MRLFLVLLSFILISCSSFKPTEDRTLIPSKNGVYTLESWACGVPFIGTSGCLLTSDDDLSKKYIKIVIPNTNNQGVNSSMQILSQNCNVQINRSVVPGDEIVFSLEDLIGESRLRYNCDLDIVIGPKWQNQDQYTIPVYPLLGRILLVLSDNRSTVVSLKPSYPYGLSGGFIKITQKSGVTLTKKIIVNTQGSKAGRIFFVGCENLSTVDYRTENPTIDIPIQKDSCKFVASILRLDVRGDLSFFGQIEVLPNLYVFLNTPKINNKELILDPVVPVSSIDGEAFFGNTRRLKPSELKGAHYLRQTTTNGRQSLSLIYNGIIKWTIQ